ncbi:MAG TPA: hypothetical protein VEY95_04585 [Azospirillaceae bacterium]|nr:hypothetical protein [Azospirillaceae bacterium]
MPSRPVRNAAIAAILCGAMTATPVLAQGGSSATVTITGLEQAIDVLKAREAYGGKEQVGLLAALSVLSLVGKQEGAARTYRIETRPDGKLLVNGVDVGPMIRSLETKVRTGK